MNITGTTIPYAVLGHPVAHTLSPPMHNANLQALGMNAIYQAFDVHPDHLLSVLESMRHIGFGGVNITIPHKEIAFRGLEQLADSATLVGGVNTVEFSENGMIGHSTDGYGFLQDLKESFDFSIEGKSVFVLGCGGAGRAVALVTAQHGAREVILSSRNEERRKKVEAEIHALGLDTKVVHEGDPASADLVVNGTPVGMKPDDKPLLSKEKFHADQVVYDLIYVVPETAFMKPALEAGAKAKNGIGMLLHQGIRSFEIWTGKSADEPAMRHALLEHLNSKPA